MGKYPFYRFSNVPYFKSSEQYLGEILTTDTWMRDQLKRILPLHDGKRNKRANSRKRFYRFSLFIRNVVIPEIMMEYHDSIEDFIRKNNCYIKMGKEVILNLTDADIEVIKIRWSEDIGKMGKKFNESEFGVGPVDLMLMVLKCRGNLSECARRLKISRSSIRKLIENNKTLFAIYLEIEQLILDYVEYQLQKKIDDGDRMAIQFYLNAHGAERGYGSYEARRRVGKTIRGESMRDDDFQLE